MPKKRRILITGVCGCIGSHILDELMLRGETVVGVDNLSVGKLSHIRQHLGKKNFRFHKLDVCDFAALRKKVGPVDVILHAASHKKIGEGQPGWSVLMVNAKGAESALRLAKLNRAKTVVFSTSDVYGVSEKLPFHEDDNCVIGPSTAKRWSYAVSKLFCEQLALSYAKDFKIPVIVIRYFGVFSERSSTTWSGGHIPTFIDSILRGKRITVHGDGSQTRSMGYVADTVRGTLLAMDTPKAVGEIINIGNNEEVSVLDTARLIHQLSRSKKPLKVKFVPMKKVFGTYKEITRRLPDLQKAARLLGYAPRVSLREGLQRVIRHHQKMMTRP